MSNDPNQPQTPYGQSPYSQLAQPYVQPQYNAPPVPNYAPPPPKNHAVDCGLRSASSSV